MKTVGNGGRNRSRWQRQAAFPPSILVQAEPGASPANQSFQENPKRPKLSASPEMLARRVAALGEIRKHTPYRGLTDPVKWQ